jgi:hypothetical protein
LHRHHGEDRDLAARIDVGPVLQLAIGRMAARQEPKISRARRKARDEAALELDIGASNRTNGDWRVVAQADFHRVTSHHVTSGVCPASSWFVAAEMCAR